MVQTVQSIHHLQFKRCHLQIDITANNCYICDIMSIQEKTWTIDSEWTQESGHFKYYYVISKNFDCESSGGYVKNDFLNHMYEMYGPPGKRWGFRFDRSFDKISLYFCNQEDAIIFRLTHG